MSRCRRWRGAPPRPKATAKWWPRRILPGLMWWSRLYWSPASFPSVQRLAHQRRSRASLQQSTLRRPLDALVGHGRELAPMRRATEDEGEQYPRDHQGQPSQRDGGHLEPGLKTEAEVERHSYECR